MLHEWLHLLWSLNPKVPAAAKGWGKYWECHQFSIYPQAWQLGGLGIRPCLTTVGIQIEDLIC